MLEQTVYRYKKRHLPGAAWTIPIIGKFADSVSPTLENYMKQWLSGPLSAVSVFNMCVSTIIPPIVTAKYCCSFIVIASTTELSRKILNSPNHAEPCLVHAAKQIILPNNW